MTSRASPCGRLYVDAREAALDRPGFSGDRRAWPARDVTLERGPTLAKDLSHERKDSARQEGIRMKKLLAFALVGLTMVGCAAGDPNDANGDGLDDETREPIAENEDEQVDSTEAAASKTCYAVQGERRYREGSMVTVEVRVKNNCDSAKLQLDLKWARDSKCTQVNKGSVGTLKYSYSPDWGIVWRSVKKC
jgi:type IV pilus biogenesis protein CpaD/CtpE